MTTLLALSSRQPGASPPVESTLRHILAVVKASASLIEAQGNATWLSTLCEFDGLGNTSAQFVALNRELDQGLDELQLHWAFEAHYSAAERAEEERALREDMQANRAVMLEVLVSLSEISGEQHGIKSLVEVGREASISPRRRRVPFSVRWFASFFLSRGRQVGHSASRFLAVIALATPPQNLSVAEDRRHRGQAATLELIRRDLQALLELQPKPGGGQEASQQQQQQHSAARATMVSSDPLASAASSLLPRVRATWTAGEGGDAGSRLSTWQPPPLQAQQQAQQQQAELLAAIDQRLARFDALAAEMRGMAVCGSSSSGYASSGASSMAQQPQGDAASPLAPSTPSLPSEASSLQQRLLAGRAGGPAVLPVSSSSGSSPALLQPPGLAHGGQPLQVQQGFPVTPGPGHIRSMVQRWPPIAKP